MRERSDFNEIEVKVLPEGRHNRLVELAQSAAPQGWKMVRKPHVAFFDLYFDNQERDLTRRGDHLRVRFGNKAFRTKGTYKLFFKEAVRLAPDVKHLNRREVRTDLKRGDLLMYRSGKLPGLAAGLAYESMGPNPEDRILYPVCVISTFRRYFTMRNPALPGTDYLNLSIELSTAFSAREVEIDSLLETGFIIGPEEPAGYDFELAEAELTIEDEPKADAMFSRLVQALSSEYQIVTTPKYEKCLSALGIH